MLTVADRLALRDLVHAYAAGVDDRRFDDVVELFTGTAELIVPDPPHTLEPTRGHRGADAVRSALAAVAVAARTQHAIVGELYGLGPQCGEALGRIVCTAHHWSRRGDEITDLVWYLRYDDEYSLTDTGWRIRRRALTIDAIESRPARRVR
jgi:hypothetical protein